MATINQGTPNAIPFTYTVYKDEHQLRNTGTTEFTYSIKRVFCDTEELVVTLGTVQPNTTEILPVSKVDGKYFIEIKQGANTASIENIYQFNNLLLSFLEKIEELACGCGTCTDCQEDHDVNLLKINCATAGLSYYNLFTKKYDAYYDNLADNIECELSQEISQFLNAKITCGKEDSHLLFIQNMGLKYLAFYYIDLNDAVDLEEQEYVKNKYKSSRILNCLKKLGISIEEAIKDLTTSARIYFWQETDLAKTVEQIAIEVSAPNYIGTKPSAEYEEFEVGKVVNYTSTGKISFAIENTSGLKNYSMYDVIGNDVTPGFVKSVITPTLVLYTSYLHYIPGPIRFVIRLNK